MKTVAIISLTMLILLGLNTTASAKTARAAETSSAGNLEVDGSFAFATGPGSYDRGFGLSFGAGYQLGEIDRNLQARVDISFYNFSYDYQQGGGTTNLSYTRVPITVSGRYSLPIIDRLKAFAQAGIETSIDHFDYYANGSKHSKSEVNIGISPGAGVEFFVNPDISVFALGRFHLVSDSYFSMQFGVASHF